MAVCDSNYNFTMVDVGYTGSECVGGIFHRSKFGQALINKTLNLPDWQPLPSWNIQFPYYIVGKYHKTLICFTCYDLFYFKFR